MNRTLSMILAAGCLGMNLACSGRSYGVSPEEPLGRYDALDAVLTGKGLDKEVDRPGSGPDGDDVEDAATALPGGRDVRSTYIDRARAGDLHAVRITVDAGGRVRSVGAEFRSDARGFDYGIYKVTRFVADYWLAVAGTPPVFADIHGKAMIGKEMLAATFERGRIEGRWVKHVMPGGIFDKIIDEVSIRCR